MTVAHPLWVYGGSVALIVMSGPAVKLGWSLTAVMVMVTVAVAQSPPVSQIW